MNGKVFSKWWQESFPTMVEIHTLSALACKSIAEFVHSQEHKYYGITLHMYVAPYKCTMSTVRTTNCEREF